MAPAIGEPEVVDQAHSRLDLDQAELVEQLQRWRHRPACDVVIQTEGNVAHARAAAVADRALSPRTPGVRLLPPLRKLLDLLETEDRLRQFAFSDYYRRIAIFRQQRHRSRDRRAQFHHSVVS